MRRPRIASPEPLCKSSPNGARRSRSCAGRLDRRWETPVVFRKCGPKVRCRPFDLERRHLMPEALTPPRPPERAASGLRQGQATQTVKSMTTTPRLGRSFSILCSRCSFQASGPGGGTLLNLETTPLARALAVPLDLLDDECVQHGSILCPERTQESNIAPALRATRPGKKGPPRPVKNSVLT